MKTKVQTIFKGGEMGNWDYLGMLAEGTLVVSKRYVTMVLSPDDRGDRSFVNLRTGVVCHYSKYFSQCEDLQFFYSVSECDLKELL